MGRIELFSILLGVLGLSNIFGIQADSPDKYFDWNVTYGIRSPLGVRERVILINGKFPGPTLDCDTNDNLYLTIHNNLAEPFLITWNGVWQRKNSWEDGVLGTNCPIPPRSSWTYRMQAKDQIGSYMYFPSTAMHRADGGYGAFNIHRRPVIALPYPVPAKEFTLLVGDWFHTGPQFTNGVANMLKYKLDNGYGMPTPDGLLINGVPTGTIFTGKARKTYLLRVSNVGITASINIRIQGHTMKLVEVEGSHVLQEIYESLDVHPGQSMSVLVTLSGAIKDYYIVTSTRFMKKTRTATAILRYKNSKVSASGPLPVGPTYQVHWSMKQARTFRWNLTANAARPNPQGAYRYGGIEITKTIILGNSAGKINGIGLNKMYYGVNNVSYVNPSTPLKLADHYNIPGVFNLKTSRDKPTPGPMVLGTTVYDLALHDYVEIIFQNNEDTTQSWHLDGHNFFVVAFGADEWNPNMRRKYNLVDAVWRSTIQVYPNSWTAVLASLDNKGMWNLRSAIWHRQYLGQQAYFRVWNNEYSVRTENLIPSNVLKCGKVAK
ncbi:L-ascorbate oxidase homolog [Chenopodium quinoa]|uniref:L-ascorbate oxidase homolog n=1 Tax=Chenopodium quinoa TaxID=63459 RepID=UPI000B77DC1C|nr:L-ascorbate oxidase homolog [Chenopodium quinoa]XP_021752667.1 L-ascorbate oxidase homolog [Chenopodium quinoa]